MVLLRVTVWIIVLTWIGIQLGSLRDTVGQKQDVHFPYVVSIQIVTTVKGPVNVQFYAAGALVSDKEVVSICHKFLESDKYWQTSGALLVVAGSSKLAGNQTGESGTAQIRHVNRVIRHPKCLSKIPDIYGFDAAILSLKKPMKLNENVQPIAMKFNDLRLLDQELSKMEKNRVICSTFRWAWAAKETPVLIVGHFNTGRPNSTRKMRRKRADGTTETENNTTANPTSFIPRVTTPGTLRNINTATTNFVPSEGGSMVKVEVTAELNENKVLITNNAACKAAFCKAGQTSCAHDFASNGQLCSVPWESSNSTCLDSGGPLVCNGYLFGILDYEHCFLQRSPAVYAGPKTILELIEPKPTKPSEILVSTATTLFLAGICLTTLVFTSLWLQW